MYDHTDNSMVYNVYNASSTSRMQGKQQQQPQSQKTLNIKRKRSKRPCMNTLWTEIESLKKKTSNYRNETVQQHGWSMLCLSHWQETKKYSSFIISNTHAPVHTKKKGDIQQILRKQSHRYSRKIAFMSCDENKKYSMKPNPTNTTNRMRCSHVNFSAFLPSV